MSVLFLVASQGALFHSKAFFTKKLAQGFLAVPLVFNPVSLQPSNAIDAFDAATKAMTEKKEKVVSSSRDRETPAAKKRRAVALCKDSDALKAAGYRTTASCTADAVEGNIDKILGASSTSTATSASSKASVSSKSEGETASKGKREKKVDLSDLSLAGKKRRALSACKRGDTRKAAKMGSESLCTERVLKGNYDALIEAIEYGY